MTRTAYPSFRRLLQVLAVLAVFFTIAGTAYAQPGSIPMPCDSFIIDTQNMFPGPVSTTISWTTSPPTTDNQLPTASVGHSIAPAPPGIPTGWSFTNAGGFTSYGPFPYPCDTVICDKDQPGKCIWVRSYYHQNPCWHEFQILSVDCPPEVRCP